jgi:hypothetical protein
MDILKWGKIAQRAIKKSRVESAQEAQRLG